MLRFASAPTDSMRLEDLRIALFNYIIAKQRKEPFIIRIEDANIENQEGSDAKVVAFLELFGIKYQDILYQSKSIRFHQTMAFDLLSRKKAFNCFCKTAKSPYDGSCENLPAEVVIDNPNPFCVRMKKPTSSIVFTDKIKAKVKYTKEEIDSFEILHVDKTPTTVFANGIDDMLNDISFIVLEERFMDDTPKHIHIREQLGYTKEIEYAHIPPIVLNEDIDVKKLLEDGFLPESISNYLILIGNKTPTEIFTLEEAIQWFEIKDIANSPTSFDMDHLRKINREHLKRLEDKELSRFVGFADSDIGKFAKLFLNEVSTTKELKEKIKPLFEPKQIPQSLQEDAKILQKIVQNAPFMDSYELFEAYILEHSNISKENLLTLLRIFLVVQNEDIPLKDAYEALKNFIVEVMK